jgi:hypothetical protein
MALDNTCMNALVKRMRKLYRQLCEGIGKGMGECRIGRPNLTEGPHVTEKGGTAKIVFTNRL